MEVASPSSAVVKLTHPSLPPSPPQSKVETALKEAGEVGSGDPASTVVRASVYVAFDISTCIYSSYLSPD